MYLVVTLDLFSKSDCSKFWCFRCRGLNILMVTFSLWAIYGYILSNAFCICSYVQISFLVKTRYGSVTVLFFLWNFCHYFVLIAVKKIETSANARTFSTKLVKIKLQHYTQSWLICCEQSQNRPAYRLASDLIRSTVDALEPYVQTVCVILIFPCSLLLYSLKLSWHSVFMCLSILEAYYHAAANSLSYKMLELHSCHVLIEEFVCVCVV